MKTCVCGDPKCRWGLEFVIFIATLYAAVGIFALALAISR